MKCNICLEGEMNSIGSTPFDKNNQNIPVVSNTLMEYYKCIKCNSIVCPEMLGWSQDRFSSDIYNDEYTKYDPDYLDKRPRVWTGLLSGLNYRKIKHLDYGSGMGILSSNLINKGWNSCSYDPYSSKLVPKGKFNFITAIEVFEHSPNIHDTIADIRKYLQRDGVILFSTLLADKDTNINWWYIMPRNGHISILSSIALINLAKRHSLFFSSLNKGIHILQTNRSAAKQIGVK